jgi:hypothetical protein
MATRTAQHEAEEATRTRTFEGLARAGYLARGVLYVLIGALALRLAFGVAASGEPSSQGSRPDQAGAMRTVAHQPLGRVLLVVIAIGLAGYALWRLAQALVGRTPEAGEHSVWQRLGGLGAFAVYAVACGLAIEVLRGSATGSSSQKTRQTTAGVLGWWGGRELVALAGLCLLGFTCFAVYRAVSRRFLEQSKTEEMRPETLRAFTAVGAAGIAARGIVFGLIGIFALRAAWAYDANDAVGLDGALARLTHHAYGSVLLTLAALGLIAFGVYSAADARYHRI